MEVDKAGVPEVLALEKICLSTVCKNIDIFNAAYPKTKNESVKKLILFLRRCYSAKIIRMLLDQSGDICLHKKYFDFLINEFLKELDWLLFRGEDLDIILEMLPKIGETLENVTFNFNSTIEDRCQPNDKKHFLNQVVKNALLHLPNVKLLRMMPSSNFDDKTLEMIYSSCKKLKELHLEGCQISNAGLKSLCPKDKRDNMFTLQSLILKSIRYCDGGVGYLLKNMPSLEYVHYYNLHNVLHKLHVKELRNNSLANVLKYKLTALCIEMNSVLAEDDETFNEYWLHDMESFEETLMIAAKLCPRISKIAVIKIKTEEQLQILCRFSELRAVRIEGIDATLDVSGFLQSSGKKITDMVIQCCKMNLTMLIENCPNLEFIHLIHCTCYISEKEQSATILKNVKKLVLKLDLSFIESGEMYLESLLDSCPNLEELLFYDSFCDSQQMSGIMQRYCEKSQALKELTFTSCVVHIDLFRGIIMNMNSTHLKKLVVNNCVERHNIEYLRWADNRHAGPWQQFREAGSLNNSCCSKIFKKCPLTVPPSRRPCICVIS